MTHTFTVEVYTDTLLITGNYDMPLYRRMSDALNSRLHRFIMLHDATVAPLARPQQSQPVPQLLVDVNRALLVAVIAEPPPPPDFVAPMPPRNTQPMMFFTSALALRADFHKRSDMELLTMLSELDDDFIPLSAVTLFPLLGGAPLVRSLVCLSRLHIQALYAVGATIQRVDPQPPPPLVEPMIEPVDEPAAPSAPATDPLDPPVSPPNTP